LCKLNGIGLNAQENLHDSLLVAVNYGAALELLISFSLREAYEIYLEVDAFVFSFLALNHHYFLNGFSDVEFLIFLQELS
jgi:hypothetical protein